MFAEDHVKAIGSSVRVLSMVETGATREETGPGEWRPIVWHRNHLDTVEEIIGRVDKGETVELLVGGGGSSLDEGATVDDFPDTVREHWSPTYSSDDEIRFGKDG